MMMAPIVTFLGLKLAFFVVYLAGNILFMTGLVAIVRQLVADRLLALVSSGLSGDRSASLTADVAIFHVHGAVFDAAIAGGGPGDAGIEPGLFASAVWLRSHLLSFVLMVVAGLLHPLIAAGGFPDVGRRLPDR